jgi:hypothetical protein
MQSIRELDASASEQYFSVRYRTHGKTESSNTKEQRAAMTANSAQRLEAIPKSFAQFPASETWEAILEHARRLPEAEHVGLFGAGEYKTWVAFDLRLHHFTVEDDGGSQINITVDDGDCDPTLLDHVQRHFAALLSTALTDSLRPGSQAGL